MYDGHISSGKFGHYRDTLGRIYQGEDIDITFEELMDMIEADYADGKLSSSQYDNLMSLAQDIE